MHNRYRTDAHQFVQPRFNERFILSLGSCSDCLVLDDELNVLPLSKGKDITLGKGDEDDRGRKKKAEELKDMKENLTGVEIVGALAKLARTVDQVRLTSRQSMSRAHGVGESASDFCRGHL